MANMSPFGAFAESMAGGLKQGYDMYQTGLVFQSQQKQLALENQIKQQQLEMQQRQNTINETTQATVKFKTVMDIAEKYRDDPAAYKTVLDNGFSDDFINGFPKDMQPLVRAFKDAPMPAQMDFAKINSEMVSLLTKGDLVGAETKIADLYGFGIKHKMGTEYSAFIKSWSDKIAGKQSQEAEVTGLTQVGGLTDPTAKAVAGMPAGTSKTEMLEKLFPEAPKPKDLQAKQYYKSIDGNIITKTFDTNNPEDIKQINKQGWKEGSNPPKADKPTEGEIIRPQEALKRITELETLKIRLQTTGGADPMSFAFASPATQEKLLGGDITGAIDHIDREIAYMEKYTGGGKKPPQKSPQTDIKSRFSADPVMKGNTLGKQTDKGYEVLQNGKLIGHYQ